MLSTHTALLHIQTQYAQSLSEDGSVIMADEEQTKEAPSVMTEESSESLPTAGDAPPATPPPQSSPKVQIEVEINGGVSVEKEAVEGAQYEVQVVSGGDERKEVAPTTPAPLKIDTTPQTPGAPGTATVTEEMVNIEDEVGHVAGEYPCSHNLIPGKLYAGSEGFTFKGTVFFYKCHFNVKWRHVKHVVPTELGYINIHVQDGVVDKEYIFTQLQHGDRIWATLVALQSESNQDTPRKEAMLTNIRASLRRMSTDPTPMASAGMNEEELVGGGTEAAYVAAATAATMDDLRLSMRSNRRISVTPKAAAEVQEMTTELTADLEAAWGQLHDHPADSYKEKAFETEELSCSLDTFEQLFLLDDAPQGFVKFMTDTGDLEVFTTPWSKRDEDNVKSRTVEYSHPINAPLAPPKASARKEQRMRRFGSRGISLETDTYVDDVPMTDCFFVTDRILISASPDNPGVVTISAFFDIRFVKSTMFRSIISNTTRSEFLKWFKNLVAMVRRETLLVKGPVGVDKEGETTADTSKGAPPAPAAPITTTVTTPRTATLPAPAPSSDLMKLLIGLVSLVLLLQVRIMFNMSSMQRSMMDMQRQQSKMCELPQVVKNAVLNQHECEEIMADKKFAAKDEL